MQASQGAVADGVRGSATSCVPGKRTHLVAPVFRVSFTFDLLDFSQEDEIILIAVGGALGAFAGFVQLRMGWGGPAAVRTISSVAKRGI